MIPLGFDINREKKQFGIIKTYCITQKTKANQGK